MKRPYTVGERQTEIVHTMYIQLWNVPLLDEVPWVEHFRDLVSPFLPRMAAIFVLILCEYNAVHQPEWETFR